MLTDSYGRAITYLRVSVTDRCNLRCTYCMPPEGVALKPREGILRYEQIAAVAAAAGRLGFTKIKLTGGEPLLRPNLERLVTGIAALGAYRDIGMTTNGTLLTPTLALALKAAGLMRVNVSLDTLEPERYAALTRGGRLRDALAGMEAARTAGLSPVKVNMVVGPDTPRTEVERMHRFCRDQGLALQTIRRFSLGDPGEADSDACTTDRPPRCDSCNRLRLTADGMLVSCLRSEGEVSVDFDHVEESIRAAVHGKPRRGTVCTTRAMSQTGG